MSTPPLAFRLQNEVWEDANVTGYRNRIFQVQDWREQTDPRDQRDPTRDPGDPGDPQGHPARHCLTVLAPGWRDAVDIYARTQGAGDYWQWLQTGGAPLVVYDQSGTAVNQPLWT